MENVKRDFPAIIAEKNDEVMTLASERFAAIEEGLAEIKGELMRDEATRTLAQSVNVINHAVAEVREDVQRLYRDLGSTGTIKVGGFWENIKAGTLRIKDMAISIPTLIIALVFFKSQRFFFVSDEHTAEDEVTEKNMFSFITQEKHGMESVSVPGPSYIVEEGEELVINRSFLAEPYLVLEAAGTGDLVERSFVSIEAAIASGTFSEDEDGNITIVGRTGGSLIVSTLRSVGLSSSISLLALAQAATVIGVSGFHKISGMLVGIFSNTLTKLIKLPAGSDFNFQNLFKR